MYRLKGILVLLVGLAMVISGVVLTGLWIGFCFGTVIVGILLLLFAPPILLLPYAFISMAGWRVMDRGMLIYRRIIL